MWKTLKHLGHAGEGVKRVDGVHNRRVIGCDLHITNNLVAVFILAHTSVELAAEAMRAVSWSVVIWPSHTQSQVQVCERSVNDTTLETRLIAVGSLAITAKSSLSIKEGGVRHILLISVNSPVPVGMDALVVALIAEQVLVQLHVPAMPGEESGDEVNLGLQGGMGVDKIIHASLDVVDELVRLLGKVAHADCGAEVFLLLGTGEFAPFFADDGVGAGLGGARNRVGEGAGDKRQTGEKCLNEHLGI
ncbi:hypothetical protein HG530_012387 [Fusarium avenaceum]|nr:hypothetical protein HG530_012387 [Fusarium avenaceum]